MNGRRDVAVQGASIPVGCQGMNLKLVADAPEIEIGDLSVDRETKSAKVARADVKGSGRATIDGHAGDCRPLEGRLPVDLRAGTSDRDSARHAVATGELRVCGWHAHPRRKLGEIH